MMRDVEHWKNSTHQDLTDVAALRMGLSLEQREILRNNIMVPDGWGLLDKVRHYMPLCSLYAGELTREAIHAAEIAPGEASAWEKLGHAMHFLQDPGNPWHARPLLPSCQKNHTVYEEYVARNMREGFCFRRGLLDTPITSIPRPEFTQHIENGVAHLARKNVKDFLFLDTCIRTDPKWREREEIAAITLSVLTACMQMCETQIHSFSVRAASQEALPIRLPAAVTWTFLGSDKRRLSVSTTHV